MGKKYVIGVDGGTESLRAGVFDAQTGEWGGSPHVSSDGLQSC